MRKILVTGAGGFIGKALVERLAKDNLVYALICNEKEMGILPHHSNIIPVVGNLIDGKITFYPKEIYCLIHLAWTSMSTAGSAERNSIYAQMPNIMLTVNAMELAIKSKSKKFIYVGSNQEFVMGRDSMDNSVTNASAYGVIKYCARYISRYMAKDKMMFNSVAFTNVFGVGDCSKRTANLFIHKLQNGEPLNLIEGNNLYDWTYIDDAVSGLIAVMELGKNGKQYYIGSRSLVKFKEIITKVRDIIDPKGELVFGTYSDNTYTDYSKFDLNALYNDTGFECKCNFEESILKTAEWVKTLKWED